MENVNSSLVVDRLLRKTLVVDQFSVFEKLRELIGNLPEPRKEIAIAYLTNLESCVTVGSIPYLLVSRGVYTQVFQRHFLAAKIRNLDVQKKSGESEIDANARIAAKTHDLLASDAKRKTEVVDTVIDTLDEITQQSPLSEACDELNRQVSVMAWSGFEVLATDLAKSFINHAPINAGKLLGSDSTRKYFNPRAFSFDELLNRDFNMSGAVGDVLFGDRGMDSISMIRDVYSTLFPSETDLVSQLKAPQLWRLAQRRNLIVHRRAVVDKAYLANTGEKLNRGEKLRVTAEEVESDLIFLTRLGGTLLCRNFS